MSGKFLEVANLPFCKGCGHTIVIRNIETALSGIPELKQNDVVMVSDIGCIGIIDRQFSTHTVHGLHGRSVALASGIAMGLKNRDKKIIVLLGDGGATIGLQHLLDAAHRNLDMTVIVHNNMLYGMTGGQPSSLTPCGYRTPIMPEGKPDRGVDLCALVSAAGAPYVARMAATGDCSGELREAFAFRGFSFIEMMELCISHGTRLNPGKNIRELVAGAGLKLGRLTFIPVNSLAGPAAPGGNAGGEEKTDSPEMTGQAEMTGRTAPATSAPVSSVPAISAPVSSAPVSSTPVSPVPNSLFALHRPIDIRAEYFPSTQREPQTMASEPVRRKFRLAIMLAGSAGEGVQSVAELLAKSAMACGYHVSKKGSYPVTVGVGFSVAEVIISSAPIRFTGTLSPDVLIITSNDGLGKVKNQLSDMMGGWVYADAGLLLPATRADVRAVGYREKAGEKNACLLAVMDFLKREKAIPLNALTDTMRAAKGRSMDPDALARLLDE